MKFKHFNLLLALSLILSSNALAATTWYVDGANGNDTNDCASATTACKTIGRAISLAASGDAIKVAAAIYPENLSIANNLTIVGAGARTTIVDGGGVGRVITISTTTAHVTIAKVTIRNGDATSGAGISNAGVLTITNSIITSNAATSRFPVGGGILNSGTLTINNSTVGNNSALYKDCLYPPKCSFAGNGGGIYNTGNAIVNNSTVEGNLTFENGAGIWGSGTLEINNSTITGNNSSLGDGGGIWSVGSLAINSSTISGNTGRGAGIFIQFGTSVIQNTIVANNMFGGNCVGPLTSNGYNLSSDGTCAFSGPGDMNNTDPLLGPLQSNGGPTRTMALLEGSPAIDTGNPAGCTDGSGHLLKTDQRGLPRPDKEDSAGCDIGAYEKQTD